MNSCKNWLPLLPRVAAVLCLLLGVRWAAAQPPQPGIVSDPVEELRLVLSLLPIDEEALQFREKALGERVKALKTMSDLRRAMSLNEWRDAPPTTKKTPLIERPSKVNLMDRAARKELGKRLADEAETAAGGDRVHRLAVATMIGEIGVSLHATDLTKVGYARTLAPILLKLTQDQDAGVRVAAAMALGKINPLPDEAVKGLQQVLEKDGTPQRRAAADGLLSLVRTTSQLQKISQSVSSTSKEIIDVSTAVVPAAILGLSDTDPFVRRYSQEALFQAAASLSNLISEPDIASKYPPLEHPWSVDELKFRNERAEFIQKDEQEVQPLLEAFQKEGKTLAKTLGDQDVQVRILSRRTLEMVGNSRLRLRKRALGLPRPINGAKFEFESLTNDRLGEAIAPGVKTLANRLGDADVRVRRATIDFLEPLEDAAVPALPRLATALTDSDRFVRWAAARTLGKVGPVQTAVTVPLLARLVGDADIDVSLAASFTLERYGPQARAGVPVLVQYLTAADDPDVRIGIIYALVSIGPRDAGQMVMPLAGALASQDVRVRRAAAEALVTFGAAARPAEAALRRSLDDEDADVRRAASDALLNIK